MMRVRVTKQDIAKGIVRMPSCCPVALALQRRTKTFVQVYARWIKVDSYHTRHLPKRVAQFIKDFDRGRPVQPFSFEIEL